MSTVPHLLAARAGREPQRQALIVDGIGSLTCAGWDSRAAAVAHGLRHQGIAHGDRVGLVFGGQGWLDFAIAYCAAQRIGAVAVPLSDRLAPAELAHMLTDCGAAGLVHQEGLAPQWTAGWTATVAALDTGDLVEEIAAKPEDLAQILYTSGTTARPKGVAATHANLTFGLGAARRPFAHSQHLLHAFPIGTNAGQVMLMNALDAHPAVVTLPRFTPARFARAIEEYGVGTVFLVPAMAIELLEAGLQAGAPGSPPTEAAIQPGQKLQAGVLGSRDLSRVKLLGSAAAPLPAAVAARLTEAFPNATIANYYTSTEAAPAQTVMIFDPEHPGSVGRAIAGGGVRIASAAGETCPPNETGEVWMRSPAAPRSYFRDADATREVFAGGWIRMGDLGYLDEDGYLYLVDRESDVVKTGAYKVSTLQVEAALYEHPAIADAAVVGIAHEVLGTELAAIVVLREPIPHPQLRAFLATRLAAHEIPARIVEVDSLPRNSGGKVDKRSLQRTLA